MVEDSDSSDSDCEVRSGGREYGSTVPDPNPPPQVIDLAGGPMPKSKRTPVSRPKSTAGAGAGAGAGPGSGSGSGKKSAKKAGANAARPHPGFSAVGATRPAPVFSSGKKKKAKHVDTVQRMSLEMRQQLQTVLQQLIEVIGDEENAAYWNILRGAEIAHVCQRVPTEVAMLKGLEGWGVTKIKKVRRAAWGVRPRCGG